MDIIGERKIVVAGLCQVYTKNGDFTILTKDPLYEQTIGQKVQLSFQDAKLLNIMYCQS